MLPFRLECCCGLLSSKTLRLQCENIKLYMLFGVFENLVGYTRGGLWNV